MSGVLDAKNTNLDDAKAFLDEYNEQAMVVYYQSALASWIYNTNITDYNQQKEVSDCFVCLFTWSAYIGLCGHGHALKS